MTTTPDFCMFDTPPVSTFLPPEEVIRLDKDGFHYKGQFIADAGEAHRLMVEFLKQNTKTKPEPPTDDELMALAVAVFEDPYATDKDYARAVLERWGSA